MPGHDPDPQGRDRGSRSDHDLLLHACAALLAAASLPWQWVTPTPVDAVCLIAIGLLGGVAQVRGHGGLPPGRRSPIAPFDTRPSGRGRLRLCHWGQVPDRFVWLGAAVVAASSLYIAVARRCAQG